MAVDAETGNVLWQNETRVLPLTLAADSRGVYFHDGEQVVSLTRANGTNRWASTPVARRGKFISEFAPTLVVYDDVVLFQGSGDAKRRGGQTDSMTALDRDTGRTLWTADHPPSGYRSPDDALVLYYSFDAGDATDGSGNKNHGKPQGAQPVEGKFGGALQFS